MTYHAASSDAYDGRLIFILTHVNSLIEIVWKVPRVRLDHSLPACLKPEASDCRLQAEPTTTDRPPLASGIARPLDIAQHGDVISKGGSLPLPSSSPFPLQSSLPRPPSGSLIPPPSSFWHLYGFELMECPEPEWHSSTLALLGAIPQPAEAWVDFSADGSGGASPLKTTLHPFGALIRSFLPVESLPVFSVWLQGGGHALVRVKHLGAMRGVGGLNDRCMDHRQPRHHGQQGMAGGAGCDGSGPDMEGGGYSEVSALAVAHRVLTAMIRRESFKPGARRGKAVTGAAAGGSRSESLQGQRGEDGRMDWSLESACQRWNLEKSLPLLGQAMHALGRGGHLVAADDVASWGAAPRPPFSSAYMPPLSHPLKSVSSSLPARSATTPAAVSGALADHPPLSASFLTGSLYPPLEEEMWYIAVPLLQAPSLSLSPPGDIPLGQWEGMGSTASSHVDWDLLRQLALGAVPMHQAINLVPFNRPSTLAGGDVGGHASLKVGAFRLKSLWLYPLAVSLLNLPVRTTRHPTRSTNTPSPL